MAQPRIVYERTLPGGGVVLVEVEDTAESPRRLARVAVERRRDGSRRDGHLPPVIARVEGESVGRLAGSLIPIASDNVEVAKGLLHITGEHTARF